MRLEYGGIYPGEPDPYSGEIDFGGGDVAFTATVKKTVTGIPGTFITFKCKKLVSPAVVVTFPPYKF